MGSLYLFRKVPQASQRKQIVGEDRVMPVDKDNVVRRLHFPVLESVIKDYQLGA